MSATPADRAAEVRALCADDLDDVVRIDELHTGQRKPEYWRRVFRDFFNGGKEGLRVGLAAEADGVVRGYLLGEVRAFEFGSEACGWIFAVGVDQSALRSGIASSLLDEACRRFARVYCSLPRRRRSAVIARSSASTSGEWPCDDDDDDGGADDFASALAEARASA